ncbi:hypothetical protein HYH03_003713 [Edaphochlamys debaryana]|uniref:Endonuclease/exonuclease/phosphatase domain-containing protein n=1 Tax=Edaphochlamys debaryana TaxID=47281 RepID=A0A836C475_9CHLO|nr:hypothetical protein HYH03_003713 [Edaphochlamys debaryana]|eukprot:KAG2498459.1 hypothetical protein HYH03_003713 [Edaphochlamys debaryana]
MRLLCGCLPLGPGPGEHGPNAAAKTEPITTAAVTAATFNFPALTAEEAGGTKAPPPGAGAGGGSSVSLVAVAGGVGGSSKVDGGQASKQAAVPARRLPYRGPGSPTWLGPVALVGPAARPLGAAAAPSSVRLSPLDHGMMLTTLNPKALFLPYTLNTARLAEALSATLAEFPLLAGRLQGPPGMGRLRRLAVRRCCGFSVALTGEGALLREAAAEEPLSAFLPLAALARSGLRQLGGQLPPYFEPLDCDAALRGQEPLLKVRLTRLRPAAAKGTPHAPAPGAGLKASPAGTPGADGGCILALTIHHAVLDGRSASIFLDRLAAAYRALAAPPAPAPPPPPQPCPSLRTESGGASCGSVRGSGSSSGSSGDGGVSSDAGTGGVSSGGAASPSPEQVKPSNTAGLTPLDLGPAAVAMAAADLAAVAANGAAAAAAAQAVAAASAAAVTFDRSALFPTTWRDGEGSDGAAGPTATLTGLRVQQMPRPGWGAALSAAGRLVRSVRAEGSRWRVAGPGSRLPQPLCAEVLHLPAATVAALKALANPCTCAPGAGAVSTNDAVTSLVWTLMADLRGRPLPGTKPASSPTANGQPPAEAGGYMGLAIDLRRNGGGGGVPPGYFGNGVWCIHVPRPGPTAGPTAAPTAGAGGAACACGAAGVREGCEVVAALRAGAAAVRGCLTELRAVPDGAEQVLRTAAAQLRAPLSAQACMMAEVCRQQDAMLTSWQMPYWDLDFGPAPAALATAAAAPRNQPLQVSSLLQPVAPWSAAVMASAPPGRQRSAGPNGPIGPRGPSEPSGGSPAGGGLTLFLVVPEGAACALRASRVGQQHGGWASQQAQPGRVMAPHRRDWSAEAPTDQPGLKFRFMSWNVLAAELAHTHAAELYPQAPSSALAWPSRLQGVIAHVEEQRPDVVCLQEVDDWPGIRNALAPLGYEGVHVQRTGGRGDGCATLWLRDRLCVAGPRSAPRRPSGSAAGSRPGSQSDGVGVIPILMADHGLRDNVALVVHLRPRSPGEGRRGGGRAGSEGEGRGGGGGGSRQAGPRRAAPSGSDMELEEEEERLDRGGGQGRSDRTSSDGGASGSGGSDGGGGDAGGLRRRLKAQPSGTPRHKRFRSSDEEAERADGGGGGGRGGGGGGEAGRATAAATAGIAALRPYTPNARQTAAPSSSRDAAAAGPGPGPAPQRLAGSGAAGQALPPGVQQGFLVANTHILFNTKRGDIKLGQMRVVLNALAAAAAQAASRKAEAEAEPGAEAEDPAGAPSAADAAATAPGEAAAAAGGESEGSRSKRRQRRKSAAATPDAAAAAAARAAALLRDGDDDGNDASTGEATAAATAPHRAVSAPALGPGAAAAADPDGPAGPPPLPCIFAGDFNSAPGSGLYRFLSGDRLDLAGEDRRELSGQVEGYGYPSLQRDVQYGRPPRLARWAPPPPAPPVPPAAALGRAASNRSGSGSDMERGASGGRSYALRWEVEELVHAMGRAAVADSMAAAKAATASAAAAAAGPAGAGDGTAGAAAAAAAAAASGLRVPFQPPQPTPWQQMQGRGRGGGGGGSRGGGGGPPSDWWARPDAAVVRNPLAPLASAYAAADPAGREPLFTTMHARYVGTVDFVWYTPGGAGGTPSGASGSESAAVNGGGSSSNGDAVSNGGRRVGRSGAAAGAGGGDPGGVRGWRLEPVRVLHPPDPLAYMYGMPCHGWPSDHVSLVVDFRLSQG